MISRAATPKNVISFKHRLDRGFPTIAKPIRGHELFSEPADAGMIQDIEFEILAQINHL